MARDASCRAAGGHPPGDPAAGSGPVCGQRHWSLVCHSASLHLRPAAGDDAPGLRRPRQGPPSHRGSPTGRSCGSYCLVPATAGLFAGSHECRPCTVFLGRHGPHRHGRLHGPEAARKSNMTCPTLQPRTHDELVQCDSCSDPISPICWTQRFWRVQLLCRRQLGSASLDSVSGTSAQRILRGS